MAWKSAFNKAMTAFKSGNYHDAVTQCTQAIELAGTDKQYYVYDCRAAANEHLGKMKDALRDAKAIIDIAPTRYQGYLRAAHLFLGVRRYDQCLLMADLALARINPDDTKRRVEIASLKDTALADKRRTTCHISQLPVELLTEIFDFLVAHDAPLVVRLSAVCKHWRDVALHTPRLWQTLTLSSRSPIRKTETWMARSMGRLREITLKRTLVDNRWTYFQLSDLKWSHLRSCRLEDWDIFSHLNEEDLQHVVASLEELDIHDKHFLRDRNSLLSHPYTALRSLILEGAIVHFENLPAAPSTLKSFIVRGNTATAVISLLNFLSGAPDIVSLTLELPFGEFQTTPYPTLKFGNLTSFNLVASPGSLHLFSYLELPALRHLVLVRSPRTIDTVLVGLPTIELVSLNIEACIVSKQSLISLLRASPHLETLAIRKLPVGVANDVLETIALESNIGRCLKHLDVSNCTDVKTGPLMRIVRARIPAEGVESSIPQLESLTVDGCPLIDGEYLQWFRQRVKRFRCVYMTKNAAKYRR